MACWKSQVDEKKKKMKTLDEKYDIQIMDELNK